MSEREIEIRIDPAPFPPRWPSTYSLPPYVDNPCSCRPAEITTAKDQVRKRRVYIQGTRDHNCPVHWSEAP